MATDKEKRNGMPAGIFQSTARPETPAEQGGEIPAEDGVDEMAAPAKPARTKVRAKKPAATGADKDGWKLYLSEDVRFRLRMLAFKRGAKLSTVANEVLDRALPRWTLERTE